MFRRRLNTFIPTGRRRLVDKHLQTIFSKFHGLNTPEEAAEWMVKQYGDRKSGEEFRPLFHNYAYGFHKKRFLAAIFSIGHKVGMGKFMKMHDHENWVKVGSPTEPTIVQINDWSELFMTKTESMLNYNNANKYNLFINATLILINFYYLGLKPVGLTLLIGILLSEGMGYIAGGAACGSSVLTYAMFGLAVFTKRPFGQIFSSPNFLDLVRVFALVETISGIAGDPTGQRIAHGAHACGVLIGFLVNRYG